MRQISIVFAALIAASLGFGCASKSPPPPSTVVKELREMSDAVPKVVTDPARAARVKAATGKLESELLAFRFQVNNLDTDLRRLNARREVSSNELGARLDLFDFERKAVRSRVMDLHFELTAATTAGEWQQLKGYERGAIGPHLVGGALGSSTGFLHAGRSFEDTRKRALDAVSTRARSDAVAGVFVAIEKDVKQLAADRAQFEKEALAVLENHEAKRTDFDSLLARADLLNIAARTAFLAHREALRARINEPEWAALWADTTTIQAFKEGQGF